MNETTIIPIAFKNSDIVDVLVNAFEGGSDYWYCLPDLSMVKKVDGKAISERITMAAFEGAVIPVHDLEDEDELLGNITKENIERGLKLFIEDGRIFNPDEMDAGDADVLLQFIVMGEIVFG